MPGFDPLIVTGPARAGTTMAALLLSAHREIMVASDPYLPLFRSLRAAIMRHQPSGFPGFDPGSPLQDYYFSDERIAVMDAIQSAGLNVPFDQNEREAFLERSVQRAAVMAPDLVEYFQRLTGPDYRTIFERAFDIVAAARDAGGRRWVGFKDVWIIEFFRPIAQAFPSAKFLVVLRDPRDIIASMMAIEDPTQIAHPLSYARHWRKYVAFIEHYRRDPLFAGRLHVATLEDLVAKPESSVAELCDFLGVDHEPAMLDASKYFDYAKGAVWTGNSSFVRTKSDAPGRLPSARWRERLDVRLRVLVDYVCGPDMSLMGYQPDTVNSVEDRRALDYILETQDRAVNWRSDFTDPQQDFGFECFRRALLAPSAKVQPSSKLLRRSFLFPELYSALCHRQVSVSQ